MKIKRIKFQNYTVFEDQQMEFSPGINVIIGENGTGKTHLMKALYSAWSTNCIHDYYQDAGHKYGEIGFLKDTDFVIESDKAIYLVEYKNANVPGAAKPDAFRPEKDIILNKVAEKYFDTLHCLYLLGKNKPKKYIYVLEYPNGNSTSRLMIRNLLQKKLPFRLQTQLSAGKVRLIDEVKVVNIEEWNADPELGRYPIKQRKTEESEKVKNEE